MSSEWSVLEYDSEWFIGLLNTPTNTHTNTSEANSEPAKRTNQRTNIQTNGLLVACCLLAYLLGWLVGWLVACVLVRCVVLCCVVSCRVVSCRVVSHGVAWCRVVSRGVAWCREVSRGVASLLPACLLACPRVAAATIYLRSCELWWCGVVWSTTREGNNTARPDSATSACLSVHCGSRLMLRSSRLLNLVFRF